MKATIENETKSAVLLQATQCIFSQQSSGYIAKESDSSISPQWMEIIKGIFNIPKYKRLH